MAEIKTDGMQTKQKIMIGVIIVIFLIIAWQLKVMLFPATPANTTPATVSTASPAQAMNQPAPSSSIKPGPLPPRENVMTEGEKRLLALQMETEAKYIAAMNELQLLRVQSEIAKNSKDIAQNRLDAVTAQKQTLQLLSAPQPTAATYAQGLSGGPVPPAGGAAIAPPKQQAAYVVVSVSQINHRWTAVVGHQGQLFSVFVGDVLSPDGAKVIGIDRYGVTLDRDGNKERVSLVSLI